MTDQQKWQAVIENDTHADGLFYYAVQSTGIYCRPSCKSKPPLKENIRFFDSAEKAAGAGFRPCKRCRPDLYEYQPVLQIADKAKDIIDQFYADRQQLSQELERIGISSSRMVQIFKAQFGMTPSGYVESLRIQHANSLLETDMPIIDIAYLLGFESLSSFYGFYRKTMGVTPREYRLRKGKRSPSDIQFTVFETALGNVSIAENKSAVTHIQFGSYENREAKPSMLAEEAAGQINEYFKRQRTDFNFPVTALGTPFQQRVWKATQKIPYGETRSYKDIACYIGQQGASRAVGMALHKNPLLLIIPCHRVVSTNGSLKGYAGGSDIKKKLLQLEGSILE